jgi:Fe(3+) dicitrate transport protein
MKLKLKLASILFIGLCYANAQNTLPGYTVRGKVTDSKEGLPFAQVFVKGTSNGTITDSQGLFALNNVTGENSMLVVQSMGYRSATMSIGHAADEVIVVLEPDNQLIGEVSVSGSRIGQLRHLPGSAAILRAGDIDAVHPASGNDVLRSLSGVHIVEEEGAGLRLNIGIRGLDPDKSRNVLVLEDGVPVALAPYGEPEMYFTPNIERMSGVEVLKGHGSILFGPQTIGGVVNYITADPPAESKGYISLKYGDMGYRSIYADYGNSNGNAGYKLSFNRKEASSFGPTEYLLHDIMAKISLNVSPVSKIDLKLGIYDENSNATYVGITQPMYDAGMYDNLRIAPDDNLQVRRYSASANAKRQLTENLHLSSLVFGYTTARNWTRQDFSNSMPSSGFTGVVHGDTLQPRGAIYMRNSTGQRNRQFEVAGIEPKLSYRFKLGRIGNLTEAGTRYLYEKAYEQRVNGSKPGALSGSLFSDEARDAQALAAYIQNKTSLTEKLTLSYGLRSENIWYSRSIYRAANKDTLVSGRSTAAGLIPGAGINYQFTEKAGVFAGVHRGFAPPRTKDAISSNGSNVELDAEKSWNFEIGARIRNKWAEAEAALFYMDFSNQVIPVAESAGGSGAGSINGGATEHKGAELAAKISAASLMAYGWDAGLNVSATVARSEFASDRFVASKTGPADTLLVNIKGNRTPYSPEALVTAGLFAQIPAGIKFYIYANYVGKQYTDILNTENVYSWIELAQADAGNNYTQADASGRIGAIDAYWTLNASISYQHKSGIGASVSVKNMTDNRYIATRRPQGIRTGAERFVSGGVSFRF